MSAWLTSLFANPWMLLWLPTIAAPLMIHLWYRRKYREVQWAAMEYLLAAIIKSSRRMRIEQLLLLLVRTLLLLLVVLALAEPLLHSATPLLVGEEPTHHIIVIDGSYSMGYPSSGKAAFDVAKENAKQIVRQGNPGDGYSLILMVDEAQQVVGQATVNQADFLQEIEKLTIREEGANVDAALRAVEEVIAKSPAKSGRWKRHEISVFSDLAKNTWSRDGKSDAVLRERDGRLERLGQNGVVEVVPIGSSEKENLAVTTVELADSLATTAGPVTITAVLHNFSSGRIVQQPVELWVDNHRVDQQLIDIPSGEDVSVSFQHRFHLPGDHVIGIHADGDLLPVDNRRLLAVPVKEHINALLVSGKRGATLPLQAALDGGDLSHGISSEIRPEVVSESKLLERDLENYDCLFLCNVGQLTLQEAQRLSEYLAAGGGLVTILGDQTVLEQYNRHLLKPKKAQPGEGVGKDVLPARLEEMVYDDQYHFIDPRGYKHPLLSKWKGNPRTGLLTVPVIKYIRLKVPEASEAEVVLWLDTGDPLLVLKEVGRGRSLLLATDPSDSSHINSDDSRPWSLIASWLNAQPFLEGLWKEVIGGQINQRNVLVGEALTARLPPSVALETIEVSPPDGQARSQPVNPNSQYTTWAFFETPVSGVYRVSFDEGRDSSQENRLAVTDSGTQATDRKDGIMLFAVNVDTRESDLKALNPADLSEGWNLSADREATGSLQSLTSAAAFPFHALLLWAVLALLFTETFLAWWIGNRFA